MRKIRVLVVDDQPQLTRLVRLLLERSGAYEVREETQALRALETARAYRPDVVVLDVDMPDRNGPEVARDLWEDYDLRSTPVLFLTALVSKHEAGIRETSRGPVRFVAKPADALQLVAAIESVIPSSCAVAE